MKFSILAVAAILSTGAHAQEDCEACPNGISVDPSTTTSGTNTCGGIAAAAAGPGSENAGTCAAIKAYESLCCPSGGTATTEAATTEAPMTTAPATTEAPMTTAAPATMCEACPDGISVDPSETTSGTNTCGGISDAAAGVTADSNTCAAIKAFESKCCPSGGAATAAAATTEAPKTTAAATTEAPETTAVATTEAPMTTAAPASTCEACPNGISVDPSETTSGTNTCGTITTDAAKFTTEDATCARIQAFESKCCPSGGAAATTEAPKTTAAATTEAPKTTEAATTEATAASDTTVAPVATTEETTTTSSTAAAVSSTTSTAASTTTSVPVASGFNAIYNDDSAGHSFSAKHGFTLASIVVCVVSAMFM